MVGDLGSQVEYAAAVRQDSHQVEGSTNVKSVTSAISRETGWPDHELASNSQSAGGIPSTTRDGVQTGTIMAKGTSESPQVSEEFGELKVANNGDLVIADRFWTVFCQEVCSSSATFAKLLRRNLSFVSTPYFPKKYQIIAYEHRINFMIAAAKRAASTPEFELT